MVLKDGVWFPRNTKKADDLDIINLDTYWVDIIKKKLLAIRSYGTFESMPKSERTNLKTREGYKQVPI